MTNISRKTLFGDLKKCGNSNFGQFNNNEPLNIIKNNRNANKIIVYALNNNYFLNKNGKLFKLTDDDETIDQIVTFNEFIDFIKNKIITGIDINDIDTWTRSYASEKEEIMYKIKNKCLKDPVMVDVKYQDSCAICTEPLLNGKKICRPDYCTHYFHCNCYNKYKKHYINEYHDQMIPCPICRKKSFILKCIIPF